MRFLTLLVFVLISHQGLSQAITQDTIHKKISESWRNIYVPKTLLRLGVGYQSSFFTELGVTRRKYSGADLATIGSAYYGAVEWVLKKGAVSNDVFGLKLGGELTLQAFLLGLESKYQTDFKSSDIVITPKVGIGEALITGALVSNAYACYGYNISLNNSPFERIGRHQFSITINPIVLSYLLNKRNYTKKLYK
jgi:hypothetical protein